jgi:hypothetical protein
VRACPLNSGICIASDVIPKGKVSIVFSPDVLQAAANKIARFPVFIKPGDAMISNDFAQPSVSSNPVRKIQINEGSRAKDITL